MIELDVPAQDVHHLHEGLRQVQQVEEGVVLADGVEQIHGVVRFQVALGAPFGIKAGRRGRQAGHLGGGQNPWDDEIAPVLELLALAVAQAMRQAGLVHDSMP